jgi:hypothetical protein
LKGLGNFSNKWMLVSTSEKIAGAPLDQCFFSMFLANQLCPCSAGPISQLQLQLLGVSLTKILLLQYETANTTRLIEQGV